MSGTSLDGLDIVYCTFFRNNDKWQYEITSFSNIGYNNELRSKLKDAFNISSSELEMLDIEYGQWLGEKTNTFILENKLEVDLIASHGHTIFHKPEEGITVQIGSGQRIASITGKTVVCDFRKYDVELGGQGAPLVPIGDKNLFSEYIACLNLGGISNISFDYEGERIAFDIGILNMLLNYLSNQLDREYDENGEIARSGKIDQKLLYGLNDLDYYKQPFPKSIGYEWFIADIKPLVDSINISIKDKLATSVEHQAEQVGKVFTHYLNEPGNILVTGGGALNVYLFERIKSYSPDYLDIIIPAKTLVDYKEALIFAFMGILRIHDEVNCLRSVTGASRDSICGDIFYPVS